MNCRLRWLLRVLVLSVSALPACGNSDGKTQPTSLAPAFFQSIQLQNRREDGETMTESRFREAAERVFRAAAPPGVRVSRAALTGRLENTDEQKQVFLSIEVNVSGTARPVKTSLLAVAGVDRPDLEIVEKGLADLRLAVTDLLHLLHASNGRRVEALASSELDVQLLAAFLLGENKVEDAVAPLCRMLGDPREEASDAAAEALKKIGTRAAVPVIIQSIRRGDLRSEVRAMEVIGRIGGKEAEAYLEMVAVGHEIPEVRALSRSLLMTLRKSPER